MSLSASRPSMPFWRGCADATFPTLQLTEDGHHGRVVLFVIRPRSCEKLVQRNQVAHFEHVKQRFALRPALYLMHAQQLGSSRTDAVALRLGQARSSIVCKTQSALLPDRIGDERVHRTSFGLRGYRTTCATGWA